VTEAFTVCPQKVHVLSADASEVDVEDIIQAPEVTLDPSQRSIRVSGADRTEEGSIDGELVASARGLKVTCGVVGDERKSLHLAFASPHELDDLVGRLEGAGLSVLRSQDDPDYKNEG
jgi:hypothetical protein